MKYFEALPKVTYNGVVLRNILLRSAIIKEVFEKRDAYYPYFINDGERPDTIAYDYYGDSNYDWLVLFSNNIVDPHHQWPLRDRDLLVHLQKKYGKTIEELKSEVRHYYYGGIGGNIETEGDVARKSWLIYPEAWSHLDGEARSGWLPKTVFDWEVETNNEKRKIRLLDKAYVRQVVTELDRQFNG